MAKTTAKASPRAAKPAAKSAKPAAKAAKPASKAAAPKTAPLPEPVSRMDMLRREFDRLVDRMSPIDWRMPGFGPGGFELKMPAWADWQSAPAVNFTETNGSYSITAELPGMEQDNVDITLANGILTIKGEKTEEKVEKNKDYHMSERRFGRFQRSFRLPEGIDVDKINADMAKGVLTITVPKSKQAKVAEKKISVKSA